MPDYAAHDQHTHEPHGDHEHGTKTYQRFPLFGVIVSALALALAIVGVYFSRTDLSGKLDAVEDRAAVLQAELDCRAALATQADVARIGNDIAYDEFVLALSQRDPVALETARTGLVHARDNLVAVQDLRKQTDRLCAGGG